MKRIALLGSTGSIGKSALEVIRHHSRDFRVTGLSTNANIDILYKQIQMFHPDRACVVDTAAGARLQSKLKGQGTRLFIGEDGLSALIEDARVDQVLLAISGARALPPLLKAIDCAKAVALANKEALVMAGGIIMERARRKKATIIPVDSEQSAIWQCLEGRDRSKLKKIYLTASGGPFLNTPQSRLEKVSIGKVLRHPRWRMGKKITVDSATLMNKGLEVFETMYLFGVSSPMIEVVIHPEAIIHSMVEFIDGVILAQLSATDMRIPIQYALSSPERMKGIVAGIDFYKIKRFNFAQPDFRRFPCLRLSLQAARDLGTAPCVLNAANEVSVEEFLKGKIRFIDIPSVIEKVLAVHRNCPKPGLDDIMLADTWARAKAAFYINKN
jgi:1-deoxy-D-xylulose-5-phosphate reductoisomerase